MSHLQHFYNINHLKMLFIEISKGNEEIMQPLFTDTDVHQNFETESVQKVWIVALKEHFVEAADRLNLTFDNWCFSVPHFTGIILPTKQFKLSNTS